MHCNLCNIVKRVYILWLKNKFVHIFNTYDNLQVDLNSYILQG
jgi:hypothetical protein